MCKRLFVNVNKGKKKYRLLTEDIAAVFTFVRRKLPRLPSSETMSDFETSVSK